ncbi:MAG: hypothetical protein QNJ55_15730 [Xenococcus sp. MO_188.B8]|nr:hypothetical protein [Xenococcus sp. MO_188.B8]
MKDWYQVQEEGLEIIHRGKTAKPGELVYLTKDQAKLHDKAVALADKPPAKIAEVTAASDFNDWKAQEKKAGEKSKVKSQKRRDPASASDARESSARQSRVSQSNET